MKPAVIVVFPIPHPTKRQAQLLKEEQDTLEGFQELARQGRHIPFPPTGRKTLPVAFRKKEP